jgi:hypothetical protein
MEPPVGAHAVVDADYFIGGRPTGDAGVTKMNLANTDALASRLFARYLLTLVILAR